MGGVMVNGCGAADSYYPQLILGKHYCRYCKSIQEFDLMEVKRKIRVFYIPTVAINTKFAVVCKKCKEGLYVDNTLRDELFYGRASMETANGEIVFKRANGEQKKLNDDETKEQKTEEEPARFCKTCGEPVAAGQAFCAFCGTEIDTEIDTEIEQ